MPHRRGRPTAARRKSPLPCPQIDDDDALNMDRITLYFDRRHFGRLRQLIDRLNDLASLPETT